MSTPEYLPTPDDVAKLLRARTKDDNGVELGIWSDATRPTATDVSALIDMAADELVSPTIIAACSSTARAAIAYHAACLIELSYFPEQVRSDRSPYDQLRGLADAARAELDDCIASGAPDSGGGGEGYSYHSLPVVPATLVESETTATVWRHPESAATWQRPLVPPSDAEPADVDEPDPSGPYKGDIVIGHPPLP